MSDPIIESVAIPDSLDNTRVRVMSANNADEIFEHIKQLGNDPKHRQRWIWELMQNAQDVAINNVVDVEIDYNGSEVKFTHDGLAFSEEDITHLIYHGSSKPGLAGKTGKFGTGFMTTHLLSKKVQVKGNLLDGRSFDFLLDREAKDGKDMLKVLNASWDGFKASIKYDSPHANTSFTYLDLSPLDTKTTVEPILASMIDLMPAVMAFSGIIKNVHINNNGYIQTFHVSEKSTADRVLIKCSTLDSCSVLLMHELSELKTKIAIPTDEAGRIKKLSSSTPRLYITFPLVGTDQAFPLPFLIHSQNFEPNKEREKIWIEADTPQAATNKSILEAAFQAYYEYCLTLSGKADISDTHLLADLGKLPVTEWLDKVWYKEQLVALFDKMDQLLILVSNLEDKKISLSDAIIPYANEEQLPKLWEIWNYLAKSKVPTLTKIPYWRKIIDDRRSFFEGKQHRVARSLRDCCAEIDRVESHRLNDITVTGVSPLNFIIQLATTIEEFKEQTLWAEFAILSDQNGSLQKSGALQGEEEGPEFISDTLKNIAEGLNLNIRSKLIHPNIIILSKDHQLQVYKKSTLVNALLEKVKSVDIVTVTNDFQQHSRLLLQWLLVEDRQATLPGFPILMRNGKWEKIAMSTDKYLCPVSLWPLDFEGFNDLFPTDFILAQENAFIFKNNLLAQRASTWLLMSPLYFENDTIKPDNIRHLVTMREDKEKLSSQQNAEWTMTEPIALSQIAYFNRPPDKNVIDRARGSMKRTKQLLEFITRVLLVADESGFCRYVINLVGDGNTIQVGVYPSNWLKEIKVRDWIKDPTTPNSADKPSVESLLPYFDRIPTNMELYNSLQKPEVARWLHFLDIGVGDLLRNIRSGDNEEEKMNWDQSYVSILMNDRLTPEKVTAILGDQELITAYENKKRDDELRKKTKRLAPRWNWHFKTPLNNYPATKSDANPSEVITWSNRMTTTIY